MFWSGNFIVVRELNFLLKEENVTLSQVLEADDILQECKADNKALMQFLTRPDILSELITLITEEPPATVEVVAQYRHASIACEVLTSPLSSLSDRLSLDTHQMNRLCDFINRDPPLNPLLASYFSKTVEMLLERNPKQDWYLYHIVCLRVLDFFKSRRDFLPNLLRHISTSAVADTFKYFIRLDDLFNKIVMEWLEEHQFIESLIQIICGTYVAEGAGGAAGAGGAGEEGGAGGAPSAEDGEKGARETSEKHNHERACPSPCPAAEERANGRRRARIAAVASSNACALLCDLVATGCCGEGGGTRSRTSWSLVGRVAGGGVQALLQGVFTSAPHARQHALLHGTRLLHHLLEHQPLLGGEGGTSRSQVELAVAPHLPLLHQALLRDPATYLQEEDGKAEIAGLEPKPGAVGAARVQTAALLAHLASSEVEEVSTTMLTLGTPGVLVDMFFRYPHNNFLHAQLVAFCRNAFSNPAYRTQYASHLLLECDLLTRLMDAFEENENKQAPRAGYMGHVVLLLSAVCSGGVCECVSLGEEVAARWAAFAHKLEPVLHHLATPLGGSYPSENSYELDNSLSDRLSAYYDASVAGGGAEPADSPDFIADGLGLHDDHQKQMNSAKNRFLEMADQRFDDDMWEEAPEGEGEGEVAAAGADALPEVLGDCSPWGGEAPEGGAPAAGDTWAHFDSLPAVLPPADPFAHYWPYDGEGVTGCSPLEAELVPGRGEGCVSLATNLLTAMSGMSPADVANIVNANIDLDALPPADLAPQHKIPTTGGQRADGLLTERQVAGEQHTGTQVTADNVPEEIIKENTSIVTTKVPDPLVPVLNVTNTHINVTNARLTDTDSTDNVTGAFEKVTDSFENITDAVNDTSVKTTEIPIITCDIEAQEPSSNVANSFASPNKGSVSAGDSPVTEAKDCNEIADRLDGVTLQDKCEPQSNSATDAGLGTKVLESTEAADTAER